MKTIEQLRQEIDAVDSEIIELMCRRMELAAQIGVVKKTMQCDVLDCAREKLVIKQAVEKSCGRLNTKFIEELYNLVMNESKSLQKSEDTK